MAQPWRSGARPAQPEPGDQPGPRLPDWRRAAATAGRILAATGRGLQSVLVLALVVAVAFLTSYTVVTWELARQRPDEAAWQAAVARRLDHVEKSLQDLAGRLEAVAGEAAAEPLPEAPPREQAPPPADETALGREVESLAGHVARLALALRAQGHVLVARQELGRGNAGLARDEVAAARDLLLAAARPEPGATGGAEGPLEALAGLADQVVSDLTAGRPTARERLELFWRELVLWLAPETR